MKSELFLRDRLKKLPIKCGTLLEVSGIERPPSRDKESARRLFAYPVRARASIKHRGKIHLKILLDPDSRDQERFVDLWDSSQKEVCEFAIGFSDGNAAPIFGTKCPRSRSFLWFKGIIDQLYIDLQSGDLALIRLCIQSCNSPTINPKETSSRARLSDDRARA